MSRRIRSVGVPVREGSVVPDYGMPSRGDIRRRLEGEVAAAMYEAPDYEGVREREEEEIDERAEFMRVMVEFLPVLRRFRGMRDADEIMRMSAPMAAQSLVWCMLFGDVKSKESAAKEILNRAHGKPVERQLSVNADINGMSEGEIDNDLVRIFEKVGVEKLIEVLRPGGEGKDIEVCEGSGEGVGRGKDSQGKV